MELIDEAGDGHFVYIYRNENGEPLYVGRGRQTSRSQSHAGLHAHNDELTKALSGNPNYNVEISGPFGSEKNSALVEAAVISAFRRTPILAENLRNKIDGQSAGNFRPLGVPAEFETRMRLPPLTSNALHHLTNGRRVLFVLLQKETLPDGRLGIDLANPRGIAETQERMVKWWQLKRFMVDWASQPHLIPHVLVGVAGDLRQRLVVGSLAIDDNPVLLPWNPSRGDSAVREIPVKPHPSLDYLNLRGRRVDPVIVKFGQGASEHFRIV